MLLGYNTNGFAHHTLDDAIDVVAGVGYDALALTPDVVHLPPFATDAAELRRVRRRLDELGITPVVETGARFILDPHRKHRPNLLERELEGRRRRLALLHRCAEMAAELGAGCLSVWSGRLPEGEDAEEAWNRLVEGVAELCEHARRLGVRVAFEPEPGMLVETLAQWDRLRRRVDHPALGLTLDVGHVPCTEEQTPAEAILERADELLNVHLDDVRGRVHEHLQIGEGELDWAGIGEALRASAFEGVASVELSRHSHAAPDAAREAIVRLRSCGVAQAE